MIRKRQIVRCLILLFMLSCLFYTSLVPIAHTAEYYININSGDNETGNGSQGSPWQTLYHALSQVSDLGDSISMAAGTYSIATGEEEFQHIISNDNLTIQGDTSGGTIIDGTGAMNWSLGIEIYDPNSNITIKDLKIINFTTGIYISGSGYVLVQDCEVDNSSSYGVSVINSSPDIENNIFVDNNAAIYISSTGSTISPCITNNLIYEEISNAMKIGINISANSSALVSPTIHHNTIDGGQFDGIYLSNNIDSTLSPEIKYNNITGFGDSGIHDSDTAYPSVPVLDYNNFYNPAGTNYYDVTAGDHDISGNPQYVSATDYQLQTGSSSMDAIPSTETSNDVEIDLEYNTRTFPKDMGCYEFLQETPPVDNRPATPTNESPSNFAVFTDTATSVILEASAFSDPGDNTHASTEWRVRREDRGVYNCDDYDASFNATYTSEAGLTSHDVLGIVPGMQYVWQVRYQNSNGIWSLWSEEYRFMIGTSALDSDVQIEGNTDVASYRMVSFPLWPDDNQCMTFFSDELGGAYNTTQLRLGTYDAETGGYMECGSNMTIKPGRSYWFLSRNDMDIDVSGVPVATGLDIEVGLQYGGSGGWNMIACPNNANYNWLSVEVLVSDGSGGTTFGPTPVSDLTDDNLYIDISLWRWEDGSYLDDTQTLEHHEGYWVNARAENVYLRFRSDLAIADSGQQRTVFSAYAKAFTKIKKWIAGVIDTRHALASDETPPLPPGVHDEPETKSCFIKTASY